MSDIRDVIADALARLFPPSTPDPRIPPLEGNLFGPRASLLSPLGELDRRALMREAQEMPLDPRIQGWRRP